MIWELVGSIFVGCAILCYFAFGGSEEPIQETTVELGDGLLISNYLVGNNKYIMYHRSMDSLEGLRGYISNFNHKIFRRKVIFAELSGKYGKEDVTENLRMAQGLRSDFHLSIPGACITWGDILYEFDLTDWNKLVIIDSFGKVHNIPMGKEVPNMIDWNNEFKLD